MGRGLLVSAVTLAALAWAVPAQAQIVLNRSIAGVSPGMTRQAAEVKLGRPVVSWAYDSRGNLVPGVIGGGSPYVTMRYRGGIFLSWPTAVVPRGRCPYPAGAERRSRARLNAWVQCALKLVPAAARVDEIDTTGRAQRTSSGVGVGVTYARARRALPSADCRQGPRRSVCFVAPTAPRRTQTRFLFEHGRVTVVQLQGYGACRPRDDCTPAGGGDRGGPGAGKGKPAPRIESIDCTPNPASLAAGGLVECGPNVGGIDPQKDVARIEYDYGDGSPATDFYEHQYSAPGSYTVRVTVVAKDGRSASASIVVTVNP